MRPLKTELEALAEVLHTPLGDFISDRERAEHRDPTALAQTRMFAKAIEAVDEARASRHHFYLVFRFGEDSGWLQGFGPFATKAQAQKAAADIVAVRDYSAFAVVPTNNFAAFTEQMKHLDEMPPAGKDFKLILEDAELFKIGWNGKERTRRQYLKKAGIT